MGSHCYEEEFKKYKINLFNKTYVFTSFLFLFVCPNLYAQPYHEGGFTTGVSSYYGDINNTTLFYNPSFTYGALYKRVLNQREGIRFNVNYAQFRGADSDFGNLFQKSRNATFSASLIDMNLGYEVNFLPFKFNPRWNTISAFMVGGIGWEYILNGKSSSHFAIPFGVGVKYALSYKVAVGTEVTFRKTFSDKIDGVENSGLSSEKSSLSNTDWYSFSGFFITFRLFDHSGKCPVYQ